MSRPPRKVATRFWTLEEAIDGGFFAVAAGLVVWLGWLLVTKDLTLSWREVLSVAVFWALVAYVGLPRLQQVLAKIYVPDYFVGRTVTETGILGDPVNLAVNGTEAQIHGAMQRAGWTRADEVTLRSSWGIIMSALFRRSYPAAPVSPLLLFGRQEAFAYEQEVDGTASQRHHVRFWPTPDGWVLPGGRRVGWLAAGTYDRRVGLSLFTLQVTHKVDGDIDAERDHILATVTESDPAATTTLLANMSRRSTPATAAAISSTPMGACRCSTSAGSTPPPPHHRGQRRGRPTGRCRPSCCCWPESSALGRRLPPSSGC